MIEPYYETSFGQLYHGDCLEVLPEIQCVDAIITDPPYGKTGCKWDTIIPIKPMWKQLKRLIKPGGAIVLTGSQPFTTMLISSNMEMFKYSMIWKKTKPTGYQICKIKPLSIYEDILIFGNGRITYNPVMTKRDKPRKGLVHRTNNQMKVSKGGVYVAYKEYVDKYPTTVIEVSNGSQKEKLHPTQKPIALMEYLVKTYTNDDDIVLCFAAGSGTTILACEKLNRNWIGIEISEEYCGVIERRLRKSEEIGYESGWFTDFRYSGGK